MNCLSFFSPSSSSSSSSSLFFLPFFFAYKPVGIFVRAKSVNVYVWVCHIGNLFTARECCWNTSRHQTKWMGSKRSEGNADKMHAFKALVTFWCVCVCTLYMSAIHYYKWLPICASYKRIDDLLPEISYVCVCISSRCRWFTVVQMYSTFMKLI